MIVSVCNRLSFIFKKIVVHTEWFPLIMSNTLRVGEPQEANEGRS